MLMLNPEVFNQWPLRMSSVSSSHQRRSRLSVLLVLRVSLRITCLDSRFCGRTELIDVSSAFTLTVAWLTTSDVDSQRNRTCTYLGKADATPHARVLLR